MFEKIRKRVSATCNKAEQFYNEHKVLCWVGGITIVAVIGGFIIYKRGVARTAVDVAQKTVDNIDNDKRMFEEVRNPRFYEGGYEENWNKVNEFASTLKLKPGEEYIITEASTDGIGLFGEPNIVSHFVDHEGVYPEIMRMLLQ